MYVYKYIHNIYTMYAAKTILRILYIYIHIYSTSLNEYTKHGKLVMSQTMVRIERECN